MSSDAWLERHGHRLPSLASGGAEMERSGVQSLYPSAWYRMHYITAIEFHPGISLVAGFGLPSEAHASFGAAESCVARAGQLILATGFSRDRRAWAMFIKSDQPDKITELMHSIAPPIDVWREYERPW